MHSMIERSDYQLTRNLLAREWRCKCGCGFFVHNQELFDRWQSIRNDANVIHQKSGEREYKIIINSGCRCRPHNAKKGGTSNSQHLGGRAGDGYVPGLTVLEMFEIADNLAAFQPGGIVLYPWGIHADLRHTVGLPAPITVEI